jgi:hypothetical protein
MTRLTTAALVAVSLATVSAPAVAQSLPGFQGATLRFDFASRLGQPYSTPNYSGSFAFSFGGLVAQLDVGRVGYTGGGVNWDNTYALHLGYQLSADTVVGAFYAQDFCVTGFTNCQPYIGLQAVHQLAAGGSLPGARVEGFVGRYDRRATIIDIDLAVPVMNGLDLVAGVNFWRADGTYNRFSLGAQYAFDNGFLLRGAYNRITGDSSLSTVSLGLAYNLGSGAVFSPRRYHDIHRGW